MEETERKLYEQMAKRLEVLQQISANTKIQIQFIQKRKLKGLLRLLDERAEYIQQLDHLQIGKKFTFNPKIRELANLIQEKEQEIVADNETALATAQAERKHIMEDLYSVRAQKKVRSSYCTRWIGGKGRVLNQQG